MKLSRLSSSALFHYAPWQQRRLQRRGRKRLNLRLSVCVPSESMCHSLEVACITTRVECTFAERRQPNDRRLVGRSRATRSRATWQPRASGHCGSPPRHWQAAPPAGNVQCSRASCACPRLAGGRSLPWKRQRRRAPGPLAGKVTSSADLGSNEGDPPSQLQIAKFKLKFALHGRFDPASPPHWMTRSGHAGAQRATSLCVRICQYLLGLGFRITQLLCIAQ